MSEYIQIVSKLKPKSILPEDQRFKIIDLTDIDANLTGNNNILCRNNHNIVNSGLQWNFNNNSCIINGNTHIMGNIYISGALFENSDKELKQDIIKITNAIDTLENIDGIKFKWRNSNRYDYGIIAQQIEKIIPEAVTINQSTGYKQIAYIKLIPFLLQAIKELNERLTKLQKGKEKKNKFKFFKRLFK